MDKKKAEIENAVRRLIRNLKGFHIEKAVEFEKKSKQIGLVKDALSYGLLIDL